MEAAAQELSDAAEAQHQAVQPQKRPVQPLHGGLDGPLRRGGGIGHRQLLPEKVVLHRQAQGLRLPALLGPHLARQNPLSGLEAAEQVRRGHRPLLAVQDTIPPAQRQGQNHHVGGGGTLQRTRSHGLPALQAVSTDKMAVSGQQPPKLRLAAVPADDAKGFLHLNTPPRSMVWPGEEMGDCLFPADVLQ